MKTIAFLMTILTSLSVFASPLRGINRCTTNETRWRTITINADTRTMTYTPNGPAIGAQTVHLQARADFAGKHVYESCLTVNPRIAGGAYCQSFLLLLDPTSSANGVRKGQIWFGGDFQVLYGYIGDAEKRDLTCVQ